VKESTKTELRFQRKNRLHYFGGGPLVYQNDVRLSQLFFNKTREAVVIAKSHGVVVPEDVSFSVDEIGDLGPALTACGPRVGKVEGSVVYWFGDRDRPGRVHEWVQALSFLCMGWLSFLLVLTVGRDVLLLATAALPPLAVAPRLLGEAGASWVPVGALAAVCVGAMAALRGPYVRRVAIPLHWLAPDLLGLRILPHRLLDDLRHGLVRHPLQADGRHVRRLVDHPPSVDGVEQPVSQPVGDLGGEDPLADDVLAQEVLAHEVLEAARVDGAGHQLRPPSPLAERPPGRTDRFILLRHGSIVHRAIYVTTISAGGPAEATTGLSGEVTAHMAGTPGAVNSVR